MREDFRKSAEGIPIPLWSTHGVPMILSCTELTRLVKDNIAGVILCQYCYQPFLVIHPNDYGDPPFHDFNDHKCTGNTMGSLDKSCIPEFVSREYYEKVELELLNQFWMDS